MIIDLPKKSEAWLIPDWSAPSNVQALITTRSGGVSSGRYATLNLGDHVGDDQTAVVENRARLFEQLPAEPVWLRQVHGNRVVRLGPKAESLEADAAVTMEANIVLAIQTADCLPVLLCDRAGSVVGAAHAGWRGLCSGVIENAVLEMGQASANLLAYLGPAIGPECFEVGFEVREAFLAQDPNSKIHFKEKPNDKWLADLYGLARQRLANLGVPVIHGGKYCTYLEENRFFSFRRDGVTGRMASVIWLTGKPGR